MGGKISWVIGVTAIIAVCSARAGDEVDKTTATKVGGVTIYEDKRGAEGADVKTGPITKETTPSAGSRETVVTAVKMGNVTELTGSKGTKSTVVTVGPMTGGQVNGKSVSVVRIGENVAVGTNDKGGTVQAIKAGNQVVVQGIGNVSSSEARIVVRLLQDAATGQPVAPPPTNAGIALSPFTGVGVVGDVEVDVECGQPFDIMANGGMKDSGTFEVQEGVLCIRGTGKGPDGRALGRVTVRMPALDAVSAEDGGRVTVQKATGENLRITGRSGGRIEISGEAKTVLCRVSGGSRVFGQKLKTGRMSMRLEGDGEAHCSAGLELVVMISGKGIVWCHGKPGLVTQKISGGGELRFEK